MNLKTPSLLFATAAVVAAFAAPVDAQWVLPRTPDGYPDLQGNWSNATMTPVQRPAGVGPTLSAQQVAALEGGRAEEIAAAALPSDPDREAPEVGGVFTGNALFDAASGGTGGYNQFYIDGGDAIAMYNGEYRSSLVTNPSTGAIPSLTQEAQQRRMARMRANAQFDEFDNPENRPLGERCIKSFGSNAGPPMLPNYFYNNNYTIVQTADHVMIHTEMVHDTRIIPITDHKPLPDDIRPWFGVSRGWYEGNTLVIETTNLPQKQVADQGYVYPGGSEQMKVTERLTRVDETTINYEFTVDDPGMYTAVWGGEVPFTRLDALVYEYACHEANYSLFNVLSGARAQEREGADRPIGER